MPPHLVVEHLAKIAHVDCLVARWTGVEMVRRVGRLAQAIAATDAGTKVGSILHPEIHERAHFRQ